MSVWEITVSHSALWKGQACAVIRIFTRQAHRSQACTWCVLDCTPQPHKYLSQHWRRCIGPPPPRCSAINSADLWWSRALIQMDWRDPSLWLDDPVARCGLMIARRSGKWTENNSLSSPGVQTRSALSCTVFVELYLISCWSFFSPQRTKSDKVEACFALLCRAEHIFLQ